MILSRTDILELAAPLEKPSAIRRWLERERIPYIPGPDGWPKVAESVILSRLGGHAAPPCEPELILD